MSQYHPFKIAKRILGTYLILLFIWFGYVAAMPGSWFLNFDDINVPDTMLGHPVKFELCRQSRMGAVEARGVRTVKRVGTSNPVGVQYEFPFIVENNGCTGIFLNVTRQPQVEGFYTITTNVFFSHYGLQKQTSYTSNVYYYGDSDAATHVQ